MLNTQKLIYLLPDVTYLAELLPTKKEHTFAIQTFRQINGEFFNDEDELIAANCEKLLSKIDPEEYQLILPDFLFTNSIVSIAETSEAKVKEEIKTKLLPDLGLDKDTHDVQTFIVTQHGGKSKVQISALEKSVLEAFRVPAEKQGVKITGVYPLSWTTKSIISLEPSISVVQIGTRLYSALHYIGVDQCTSQTTADVPAIAETIKTLKGAEPSVQTVYLLTNQLVEQELKKEVSGTLPLQQLTVVDEEQTELPSYVKQIIESGMRTLSIPDFPVPKFPIGKIMGLTLDQASNSEDTETKSEDSPTETESIPTIPTMPSSKSTLQAIDVFEENEEKDLEEDSDQTQKASNQDKESATDGEIDSESDNGDEAAELPAPTTPPAIITVPATDHLGADTIEASVKTPVKTAALPELPTESKVATDDSELVDSGPIVRNVFQDTPTDSAEPDLSKFSAGAQTHDSATNSSDDEFSTPEKEPVQVKPKITPRTKNKSLVRMIVVTLIVFLVTVGVGVGIGLALLSLTSKPTVTPTPVVSATPAPTAVATPTPTPEPEITRSEYSVLVVNATTVSGLAGKFQRNLQDAEYKTVAAGNAKGEYEDGSNYVLFKEGKETILATLAKDAGLTLVENTDVEISTEDPRNIYDAVIVIADAETE